MSIHEGHRERTLERFFYNGFDNFEEHQKLEMILFFSVPRADTNVVAHELIKKYKSVAGVMDAPAKELLQFKYVTKRTVQLFKMIKETYRLYECEKAAEKSFMTTTAEYYNYLRLLLQNRAEECVAGIFLDDNGKFLKANIINEGALRDVLFDPRKILEAAWGCGATTIVLSHNHPNNDPYPSNEDIEVTNKMRNLLHSVGIHLKDHIIITNDDYYSLNQNG